METVLITGGSSGIGRELAKVFADRGHDLVLVSRDEAKLNRVADRLTSEHKVKIDVIVQDLSKSGAGKKLYKQLKDKGIKVGILVNNAGFGDFGQFADSKPKANTDMINLNINTVTELTALFVLLLPLPGRMHRDRE